MILALDMGNTPIYTKEADRFLGYLSSGNSILGLA